MGAIRVSVIDPSSVVQDKGAKRKVLALEKQVYNGF